MQPVINTQCGSEFTVHLDEVPSSGYVWQAREPGEGVALIDQGYANEAPEGIGATRRKYFRFRAGERPGELTLHFELKRPWENAALREETVSVSVE
ncbi:protease inhibitor I42 family protein [Streptomyces sp. I05A-00742]|uniref:protease inhibitor I42 family protein n=1 Tax=Streptomyces sp. I05A-00742 TaxID=2732853 RepID=UPI0014899A46|nr:protease inhibitor I42 family protein [Streptomyces sp. I05A-00742]